VKWSGVKWSEVEWSGVKWSEVKWSEELHTLSYVINKKLLKNKNKNCCVFFKKKFL
jgi:hypothetical protein